MRLFLGLHGFLPRALGNVGFGVLVAVLAMAGAALAAPAAPQSLPAGSGTPLAVEPVEAEILAELDAVLRRASMEPHATPESLRDAGFRLLGERMRAWREDETRSRAGQAQPGEADELRDRASMMASRLTAALSKRVSVEAARLEEPQLEALQAAQAQRPEGAQGLAEPRADRPAAARALAAEVLGTSVLSGRVTGPSSVSGSVYVYVHESSWRVLATATIQSDGSWSASGLAAGTYYVQTRNYSGLIDQAWKDASCSFSSPEYCSATAITVAEGATVSGIDFSLVAGARIAGTVRAAADGAPIPSLYLPVYDGSDRWRTYAYTDGSGAYTTYSGLPSGTYYVMTSYSNGRPGLGFLDEGYDNNPCEPNCTVAGLTPVVVTSPATRTGIDFALEVGGAISGTVTASDGSPLNSAYVDVYTPDSRYIAEARTASDGSYNLGGLPTGSYKVRTYNYAGYVDEVYDNRPCVGSCDLAGGQAVAVTVGSTRTGISFALDPGGSVSGTVTGGGLPLAGVSVTLYTPTGTWVKSASTGTNGTYSITGLASGSYKALTSNSLGFVNEVYNDHPCEAYCSTSAGDPIAVTAGATTSGIDFALDRGGTISGRVTRSDSGASLANVPVTLWLEYGSDLVSRSYLNTNANGEYAFTGLVPGTYFLSTAAANNGINVLDELYDGLSCFGCYPWYLPWDLDYTRATPVVATAGGTTTADFALAPGGQIGGTLRRAGSATPVQGTVTASMFVGGRWVAGAGADVNGAYVINGLPAGRYAVSATGGSGELDGWYNGAAAPHAATPVEVTAGALTSGIDFTLAPGGRIAGTVTRADTGAPVAEAYVYVYTRDGSYSQEVPTDSTGAYVSRRGLPSGEYAVMASPPWSASDLTGALYNGIECLNSVQCSPADGNLVSVTSPNTTSGIDFALGTGGAISGRVTEATGGAPLPYAYVFASAVNASGNRSGRSASTASDGSYTITGLPAGGYFVLAQAQSGLYQLFPNLPCFQCDVRQGRRVDVRARATTSGIDFAMPREGAISGRITSAATGQGLRGTVELQATQGGSVRYLNYSSSDGRYTIPSPAGSYRVSVEVGGFITQRYSGVACPNYDCPAASGAPVTVVEGGTTTGIDFSLDPAGSISGSMRDSAGNPVWGAYVWSFDNAFAVSQQDGFYRLGGLAQGPHYVGTSSYQGFMPQVYNGVFCYGCDPAAAGATAVAVSAGADTPGIDFTVAPGAVITGTVRSGGRPVASASVRFKKSGAPDLGGGASTGVDGTFRATGFAPGTYYASAVANGLGERLFGGLPCSGVCDLTLGTPITVTGTTPVSGVDFDLTTQPLKFYTLDPCRLVDTREATSGPALACTGGRNFPAAGVCGVPFDAKALSVNLTVTSPSTGGWLRLHAGRSAGATTSTLNYGAGLTRANNAVVPLGAVGELAIYCGQPTGTTHGVVDVNGYFK